MINKTYIINLERKTERKNHMLKELEKLGDDKNKLKYTFYEAIDGQKEDLLEKYKLTVPTWHNLDTGKMMTKGEIGCSLSHYMIWLDIVKTVEDVSSEYYNDTKYKALILEDDIYFGENFVKNLESATSEIECEMLYVGRDACELHKEKMISERIRTVSFCYGTHAYIVTYTGAKKLVQSNYLDNIVPSDEFLTIMFGNGKSTFRNVYEKYPKLTCYAIYPNLVGVVNSRDSDTYNSEPCSSIDNLIFHDNGIDKNLVVICDQDKLKDDVLKRFQDYAKIYGWPIKFINDNDDEKDSAQLLLKELLTWPIEKLDTSLVVFIQSNNILLVSSPFEIINKFKEITNNDPSKIIIGKNLNSFEETASQKIFSSWIGWANTIIESIEQKKTKNIIVDTTNTIFQYISEPDDRDINDYTAISKLIKTPSIVYADKNIITLNTIENYTGNNWNEYYGRNNKLESEKPQALTPYIYVLIRLGSNMEMTKIIKNLNYPMEKIHLHIVTNSKPTDIQEADTQEEVKFYDDVPKLYTTEFKNFLDSECEYILYLEEHITITEKNIINDLLYYNKGIISPMFKKKTVYGQISGDHLIRMDTTEDHLITYR